MPLVNVGDGAVSGDMIQCAVQPGDTVTVKCLATSLSSLNVFQSGIDQAPTVITAGNNVALSNAGPVWLQAASGIAGCQITSPGFYGLA